MKHRVTIIVIAALVALALVSCDFMYETNFFATKMSVNADELASASVADLNEKAESESFFVALADDPDAKAAVLANLDGVIDDPDSTPEQIAEASALAAKVLIQTTPAGDLISNIGNAIPAFADSTSSESGELDIAGMITDIMPPEVLGDGDVIVEETFVAMIDALVASLEYYEAFSANMDPAAYNTVEEQAALGDIAMTAMIALLVTTIEPPVGSDYTSQGDFFYDLVTGELDPATVTMTNPDEMDTSALQVLLDASGLGGFFPAPVVE